MEINEFAWSSIVIIFGIIHDLIWANTPIRYDKLKQIDRTKQQQYNNVKLNNNKNTKTMNWNSFENVSAQTAPLLRI